MIIAGARARADRRRSELASKVGFWRRLPASNGSWTAYRRFDATGDPRDEPYCATACKYSAFPTAPTRKRAPSAASVRRVISPSATWAVSMRGANSNRRHSPTLKLSRFKREWRAAHPAIVKFWYAVDRAAWTAVRERGRVVRCGPVAFKSNGAFLQLKLPSGRKLSYPQPRIIGDEREQHVLFSDNAAGQFQGLPSRPRRLRRPVDREHRQRHRPRHSRRGDAADRGCRLSDRASRARRDRCRGAGRLRLPRRIHPSHDAQAGLGARSADRSESLERARATANRRLHCLRPADTRAPTNDNTTGGSHGAVSKSNYDTVAVSQAVDLNGEKKFRIKAVTEEDGWR